jgi:hypothetical protein
MKVTILDAPVVSSACRAAKGNFAKNVAALRHLPAMREMEGLTWMWGRDGALTCKTADGQWLLGNSLPRRTGERMLRDMRVSQSVCCFLDVPHAAFLKAALQKLSKNQGMIAVVPDAERLNILLHCEDFSEAVRGRRLWVAGGEDWMGELAKIFLDHPGLPTPNSFIRTSLTEETALQNMIARAQEIFTAETKRRNEMIADYARGSSERLPRKQKQICLIAPSVFRMWDPSTQVLAGMLTARRFDPDEPTSASPLALARAAAECDAVVAANIGRAEANGVVSPEKPWITWITRPMIPAYVGTKRDQLLLADPAWCAAAKSLGWAEEQITVAGWPRIFDPTPPGKYLALIANTMAVTIEPDHFELSSHALLWETIRRQLLDDPFEMQTEPGQYLGHLLQRCNVSPDGLDQTAFIEQLIVPTYQQSVAKILLRSACPLRLFGTGWSEIDEFKAHSGGGVEDISSMRKAVAGSAALVHAWPVRYAHPVEAMGRPVVHAAGANLMSFVRNARLAMNSKLMEPVQSLPAISAEMILSRV